MNPLITSFDNPSDDLPKEPIKTQKKGCDLVMMNNQFQSKMSHLNHRALPIVHQILLNLPFFLYRG